jgi:hypothetical protein
MINSDAGGNSQDAGDETTSEPRRFRPAALITGVLLGAMAVAAGLLTYAFLNRNTAPLLTRGAYEAAAERWNAKGPASYDLDLELAGNRPGKIHVEVRNGQATRMERDGVVPSQERTWFYWTVPGMMDTIAEELEMAEDPAKSFNVPGASQVIQRAEFDPEFGYPRKYDRVVLGADFEIHWEVTRFQPIPAEK